MADEQEPQEQERVPIMPDMVPTGSSITIVETEQGPKLVQIALQTPVGIHITFWSGETAIELGKNIMRVGQQALMPSGLTIARELPNPNGHHEQH